MYMGHSQKTCTSLLFWYKNSAPIKLIATNMFLYNVQCIFFNLIDNFVYLVDITDLYLLKGPIFHIFDCYFSKILLFIFWHSLKNDDFDIFTLSKCSLP